MLKLRESYKYCASCGSKLNIEKDYSSCPSCGRKYFYNAIPAISVVITNDKDEIFMTLRAQEPYKNFWELPGGFVAEDESLEEAVLREVKEELGVQVNELSYLTSHYDDYPYDNIQYPIVVAVFSCRLAPGTQINTNDEIVEYEFVAKDKINSKKVGFKGLRDFLKEFAS